MRNVFWMLAVAASCSAACNYTVGECYPVGQNDGSSGAGAGVVSSGAGAGTSGDTPMAAPQDLTPAPVCNITSQDPCSEKCDTDYENAASACGRIPDAGQRKSCQDGAYTSYKSCRANCAALQKTCTDMYENCMSKGYPCTKEIDRNYTLCARCREDCENGEPYKYAQCKACGFTE